MHVCLPILESSAGVGDGDDGGAQSEQGGQEMGNQSGQRTQEYHTLQKSKMDAHIRYIYPFYEYSMFKKNYS